MIILKKAPDHKALKNAYQSVFNTPEGEMVLNDLTTSLRLVQFPFCNDTSAADRRAFDDGCRYTAIRILRMLDLAGGY